jgi:hypothetical protein
MKIMDRKEMLCEYNLLRTEVQELSRRLAKLEAHEGEDGTKEDIATQCSLVDEIAAKSRRISELRSLIYPK